MKNVQHPWHRLQTATPAARHPFSDPIHPGDSVNPVQNLRDLRVLCVLRVNRRPTHAGETGPRQVPPRGGTPMTRVQTTVVGSYPIPDWLPALPSEQALKDATAVVFHTQEQAGIDLAADGELYRFDVTHPDTNGMIEYFIRP